VYAIQLAAHARFHITINYHIHNIKHIQNAAPEQPCLCAQTDLMQNQNIVKHAGFLECVRLDTADVVRILGQHTAHELCGDGSGTCEWQ